MAVAANQSGSTKARYDPIITQLNGPISSAAHIPTCIPSPSNRTTRRVIRRTAIYAATLPAGCTTVVMEGVTLHQCGATYYQPSGTQFVVVQVD